MGHGYMLPEFCKVRFENARIPIKNMAAMIYIPDVKSEASKGNSQLGGQGHNWEGFTDAEAFLAVDKQRV